MSIKRTLFSFMGIGLSLNMTAHAQNPRFPDDDLNQLTIEFIQKHCDADCKERLPYLIQVGSLGYASSEEVGKMCSDKGMVLGCATRGFDVRNPLVGPYVLVVRISSTLKEEKNFWVRRATVFHELGHALLGLKHSNDPLDPMFYTIYIGSDQYEDGTKFTDCNDKRFHWINTGTSAKPWCVPSMYIDVGDGCLVQREHSLNTPRLRYSQECRKKHGEYILLRAKYPGAAILPPGWLSPSK